MFAVAYLSIAALLMVIACIVLATAKGNMPIQLASLMASAVCALGGVGMVISCQLASHPR
jgi:hypothetical protein